MCVFCKIVNGEIPCYKVYEDDLLLAFLDISQVTKGHTLVVPKKHFNNMLECDEEILKHLYSVSQTLGNQLVCKWNALGMNVLTNVNEVAGQTVKHFHIHLIPRYDDNEGIKIDFIDSKPTKEQLIDTLEAIK